MAMSQAGERFAEGPVLECAVCRGDEGQDGDVFKGLSFSELNRLQPSLNHVFHCFSFLPAGRNSPSFRESYNMGGDKE